MPITRKLQRKMRSPSFWFKLTEIEILDIFSELPHAQRSGTGDEQYVYIPGTRTNRVVLVAHADTVWSGKEKQMDIVKVDGKYYSLTKNVGIGADDRAGCALLWRLRNDGHSLLIPNKEEGGCRGSKFLMANQDKAKEINEHQFIIEFDRVGNSDLVFYDVGSPEFTTWCEANFTGYKKANGTSTDIRYLCKDICGVNISNGSSNQHNENETLDMDDWTKTLVTTRKVLSNLDLPKFNKPKHTQCDQAAIHQAWNDNAKKSNETIYYTDTVRKCINCRCIFDFSEIIENSCPLCRKSYNVRKAAA